MAIDSIGGTLRLRPSVGPSGISGAAPAAPTSATEGFADALQNLLTEVDSSAGEANQAVTSMLDGSGDVHEAMLALHKAETSLHLTVQVRNKLVQAYQDVMRMTV